MESIHCAFSNVIYPSAASASSDGFMIAEYRSRDSRLHDSILGDFFKASGRNLPHESGNFYTLYGEWVYNKKHSNYVLQVDSFDPYIPQEKGQIIKYLSSLGDVGKDNAEKIFSTFGLKSMEVLEKKPELLIKVKNINKEDLKNIITYFQKRLSVGQVAEFLLGYNLPRSKATQVYEALGDDAVFLIEDNPFHLTKTTGISFQDVDKVAREKSVALTSELRTESAVLYALQMDGKQGNVCSEPKPIASAVYKLLNDKLIKEAIPLPILHKTINRMITDRKISYCFGDLYLNRLYEAELGTARIVSKLTSQSSPEVIGGSEKHINTASAKHGIILCDQQRMAITTSLSSGFSIITGGPGTGKTTILKILLDVYLALQHKPEEIALCAPTGRAARRMTRATGYAAETVHKCLGLTVDGDMSESPLSGVKLVVVDEASMLDIDLTYKIFSSLPEGAQLVLVGDYQQLPSVGPGDVLRDLINHSSVPVVRLDTIYRQKKDSLIVANADKIANGDTELQLNNEFQFIETKSVSQTTDEILKQYQQEITKLNQDEVQILCPVWESEKGVGVKSLNRQIQDAVNPAGGELCYQTKNRCFRINDRVMQLINDDFEGINNGDIGMIVDALPNPKNRRTVAVDVVFEGSKDDRPIRYDSENIDNLILSYAITIHKSQGSEYSTVILPMLSCYGRMLLRNLLYTAVTRGKEKVILVGERAAIVTAIQTTDIGKRNTHLKNFLDAA